MANFSKNVTKLKIAVVAMVLSVVCSAVLIGRLFYLQIIDGDYYKQMALNQQLKDTIITLVACYLRHQHEGRWPPARRCGTLFLNRRI